MPIVLLDYEPCSTFELRPSNTTKTGGKTLLCPTPYAVKMALLDRLIRYNGVDYGREQFPQVRDLHIYVQPPRVQAVNRTFQKILRPGRGKAWIETIAMREFCVQHGILSLALATDHEDFIETLLQTAASINYFGQRGSFYQLVDCAVTDELPPDYTDLTRAPATPQMGFLQRMDDMQPDATFDDISTFNPRSTGARQHTNVILPYHVAHHAHNHTVWERKDDLS